MASKKAAAAALKNLDLKKPKDEEDGKLLVSTLKRVASKYRDAQAKIEALQEQQKQYRDEMTAVCSEMRTKAEAENRFYKTCEVETNTDDVLQVTWSNSFSPLDPGHEPVLREAFGKQFDDLFEPVVQAKAEKTATLQDIVDIVGPARVAALAKYVKFNEKLKLKSNFLETWRDIKATVDSTVREAIDTVVGQVQSTPRIRIVPPKDDDA